MKKLIIVFGIVIFLGLAVGGIYYFFEKPLSLEQNPPEVQTPENQTPEQEDQSSGTKTYRNEEWGFEFLYPKDWRLEEDYFGTPSSKFTLLGDLSAENYNPVNPTFFIHIVALDFADRAAMSKKSLGAKISDFSLNGVFGKKYEYEFMDVLNVSVDIPFGEYRMLLGSDKDHEDIFDQIVASFKFLK